MKVLYIAQHGKQDNDDEGAIAYALRQLGHEVVTVLERYAEQYINFKADFCLVHHFHNLSILRRIQIPKVFWCFDLIDWPGDPTLAPRCNVRKDWIRNLTETCDIGFMTDGDWVARENHPRLHWLMQGADERITGFGKPSGRRFPPILFAGIGHGGGTHRESFVRFMKETYGERFNHVERRVYRQDLKDLIADTKIVVAPDSPVTDRYWSNRVYMMLGFGACLTHPYSRGLFDQYGGNLCFYQDREHLKELINVAIGDDALRQIQAQWGYNHTIAEHLYRHRVKKMIEIIKEKL